MRVQLMRERDEQGAIAIMVALMMTMLCVLGAFVIDFGMAYNSKRQLQTAADAGALAAAAVYVDYPGTCLDIVDAHESEAQAAAEDYIERNRPEADVTNFDADCNRKGELTVDVTVEGETDITLGKLVVDEDEIWTERAAQATLGVGVSSGSGLRPLALCSADLPPVLVPGQVFRVDYPGAGFRPPATCPDVDNSGNWWSLDCPSEQGIGSTMQLAAQIRNGCEHPVTIVPDQPTTGDLHDYLIGECPYPSESCLSGDPGQMDAGQIPDSWDYLMTNQTRIVLPVFCGLSACSPPAVEGNGTQAIYPVYKLASMVVCGYHFAPTPASKRGTTTQGVCAQNPYPDRNNMPAGSEYLLVTYVNIQTSGSTRPAACGLGGGCDSGVRTTRLTK